MDGANESCNLLFSLTKLQRLQRSFDLAEGHAPRSRRTLLRLARQIGPAALRILSAELQSPCDKRGAWAQALLTEVANGGSLDRVVAAVEPLAQAHCDHAVRRRALELLIDLQASGSVPQRVRRRVSLERALRSADSAAAVAAVASTFAALLDDEGDEELLELISGAPTHGARVAEELLLRHDLDLDMRSKLRRLRAGLGTDSRARPATVEAASIEVARSPIGRVVVLARARLRRDRWRAIAVLIDEAGLLDDAIYRDDFSTAELQRDLIAPLELSGYLFVASDEQPTRNLVAEAARNRLRATEELPTGYYLGRDLLAMTSEHLPISDSNPTALLGRSVDLLAQDCPLQARPLLERFVVLYPDDADGAVNLGLCLLALDDIANARRQFARAAWLAPRDPEHHWNLAVASLREDRAGACYLALVDFLSTARADLDPQRVSRAQRIVSDYERHAREQHPDALPTLLARTDDAIWRSQRLVESNQHADAIALLEGALLDMPVHRDLAVELALTHAVAGNLVDAKRCAEKALAVGAPAEAIEKIEVLITAQAARHLHHRLRSESESTHQQTEGE